MTAEEQYTIEMMGLDHYANWWESPADPPKDPPKDPSEDYPNRWEELTHALRKKDLLTVTRLIRESHVEAYKAGVLFKLTGGMT